MSSNFAFLTSLQVYDFDYIKELPFRFSPVYLSLSVASVLWFQMDHWFVSTFFNHLRLTAPQVEKNVTWMQVDNLNQLVLSIYSINVEA